MFSTCFESSVTDIETEVNPNAETSLALKSSHKMALLAGIIPLIMCHSEQDIGKSFQLSMFLLTHSSPTL